MKTLLLKNGSIIDGTGKKAFAGHVLIHGDRITSVMENDHLPEADTVIDAAGKVIAPGFIDMHSHSDWVLPGDDHDSAMKCLPEQGVTTVIGGNCGFSPAPISENMRQLLAMSHFKLMNDRRLDYRWDSFKEFLDCVEKARPIVNTAHQVGHASLRLGQAGLHQRLLSQKQINGCLKTLAQSFEEGACALSFGLGYEPGMYSSLAELEAFCRVAASADKPVTVHLKALSRMSPTYSPFYLKPHNVRALKEMIDIARKTGIRLQISHLIFVGKNSWSTADTCLKMIEKERARGLDIKFDAFPYTFGNTTINAVLPYWFLSRLPQVYQSRWARNVLRAELSLGFKLVGFSYNDFQIMDAGIDKWQGLNGHRVVDIARQWGLSPFDTMLKLSEESQGQTVVLFHAYSGEPGQEKVLEDVLKNDLCLFETDALTRYGGYPNPAALGTFPKILGEYVRKRKLFTMENAIQRMTSASAERFGIQDRGVLASGKKADVIVFDPETIAETPAKGHQPADRPKGIVHVFINGQHAVQNGEYMSGARAGELIRI
ncbi:MAG: amidohydrolase family protein [Desulfobacteraceae bacterium]|nr:amidohydrolase family protein [Desulfobacteraceae bacterium]